MAANPRVRVRWTRTAMGCVPKVIREEVLDGLSDVARSELEEAGPLGWLEAAHHVQLCRGWHARLGDDGFKDLFRRAFLAVVDGPLLRSIVYGSVRVFGSTPSGVARAWPVGWSQIFREGGNIELLPAGEGEVCARIFDLPPVLRDRAFMVGCAGSFLGNAALVREVGRVTIDDGRLRGGEFVLKLSW